MTLGSTNADTPRILICRFGKIGDCVMAAYGVTALRNALPNATIIWAVESSNKDFISCPELASEVWVLQRDRLKAQKRYAAAQVDLLNLCRRIHSYKFDFAFDLHGHAKTAIATRAAGRGKNVYALQRLDLLAKTLLPRPVERATEDHWVERYHAVTSQLVAAPLPQRPIMPRNETLRLDRLGIDDSRPYVVVSAGGRGADKRYPIPKWEQVIRGLHQMGYQVVLNGFTGDPSPGSEDCIDLVGMLRASDACALLSRAHLHLGADTGAGHVAAAFGVPTVSIFGPMEPAHYMPYGANSIALKVSANPACVSPEMVLSAARDLLKNRTQSVSATFSVAT